MKKPRKYGEADKYEDTPQQIKNREARNAARAKLVREGKLKKGDGKDAAHVVALDLKPGNKKGVFVESASANRSFKRDSKHNLVSEVSTRERKKKK